MSSQRNKGHHPSSQRYGDSSGHQHQTQGHHVGERHQRSPERHQGQNQGYAPMEDDKYSRHGNVHGHASQMDYHYHGNYGNAHGNASHLHYHGDPRAADPQMTQAQLQEQRQRSLQASKQMLFGVYENVIGQLEELESRELDRRVQMSRSQIEMPDQSWKKKHDIRRLVEAQLLMFETQMKNCPPSVRDEAKQQLIDTTKGWMADRHDKQLPCSDVDKFAGQLIEILKKGSTHHPDDFYHMPDMTREQIQPAVEAIMHGNTKKAALDQEFRDNPDKTASLGKIRAGRKQAEGAERITETNPDLAEHMQDEPEKMEEGEDIR